MEKMGENLILASEEFFSDKYNKAKGWYKYYIDTD